VHVRINAFARECSIYVHTSIGHAHWDIAPLPIGTFALRETPRPFLLTRSFYLTVPAVILAVVFVLAATLTRHVLERHRRHHWHETYRPTQRIELCFTAFNINK